MTATNENEEQNNCCGDGQPKTAKQLEKEAKKQAKLEKLKQKQEKLASIASKDKSQVKLETSNPYVILFVQCFVMFEVNFHKNYCILELDFVFLIILLSFS